jgi:hypothetical protein
VPKKLFAFVFCLLLTLPSTVEANQPDPIIYHNPIAYIGTDWNIYITSLDSHTSTAVTTNADPAGIWGSREGHFYGGLRWSPDGKKLAFMDRWQKMIYIMESGQIPQPVAYTDMEESIFAWSPDGTQLVYLAGQQDITILNLADHAIRIIGRTDFCTGEGYWERALELLRNEHAGSPGIADFFLAWTPVGILYSPVDDCRGSALIDTDGIPVWNIEEHEDDPDISLISVSPNGKQILAIISEYIETTEVGDPYKDKFVVLDTATGKQTASFNIDNLYLLGWSADGQSILYGTGKHERRIKCQPEKGLSDDFFARLTALCDSEDLGGFEERTLTLWQMPIQGNPPGRLYNRQGFGFGVITTVPDSEAILFSFVTSMVELAKAINVGRSESEIKAICPTRVEIILIPHKGRPETLVIGGQPAVGKGDFAVLPSTHIPPTRTCPIFSWS